jgi:hypothetical protein
VEWINGDLTDTDFDNFNVEYGDYELTHDERETVDTVRICAELARAAGNVTNNSLPDVTVSSSSMQAPVEFESSTGAYNQQNLVVSHEGDGQGILAGWGHNTLPNLFDETASSSLFSHQPNHSTNIPSYTEMPDVYQLDTYDQQSQIQHPVSQPFTTAESEAVSTRVVFQTGHQTCNWIEELPYIK